MDDGALISPEFFCDRFFPRQRGRAPEVFPPIGARIEIAAAVAVTRSVRTGSVALRSRGGESF